jgi:hypothetical protein
MSSKRKEYHVDCGAAKAAKFFLICESHINPDMKIKIPAAMMAKGYSDEESKNRMLQMQVRREVEKIKGIRSPPPSTGSGRGRDGPVDSFGPPECNESHSYNDYSRCSPPFG